MKVKQLITALQKFDPELDIGVLHDNGVLSTYEVGMYEGLFINMDGDKLIGKRENKKFVVIGNPGNYKNPKYHDVCDPIDVIEIY